MNNDNEKDLQQNSTETEELVEAEEQITEDITEDLTEDLTEELTEELTEDLAGDISDVNEVESGCAGCCSSCNGDCYAETGHENYAYAYAEPQKPKRSIMTPIIIAAVALVAVAAIVFGSLTIYKLFFSSGISGVWVEKGFEDSGVYFEFDDEGNAYLRGGGISYFGNYEIKKVNLSSDEVSDSVKSLADAESLSGDVNVLKSDFYILGLYGGEYVYTMGTEDGVKTLTLKYMDATQGAVAEWVFVEAELPAIKIDPNTVTNASADEAGIKTLQIDDNIIGSWNEADYGTYTFYADGTGNYKTNYQIDQTYTMFYGVTMGYGIDLNFKYTVGDGVVYMTVEYFSGEAQHGTMNYFLDGTNLVIDGVGYAKTEQAK